MTIFLTQRTHISHVLKIRTQYKLELHIVLNYLDKLMVPRNSVLL